MKLTLTLNYAQVLVLGLLLTFVSGCQTPKQSQSVAQEAAQAYFALYAQRQDFAAFMTFYRQDAELQDLVYGNHVSGKQAIKAFLKWDSNPISFNGSASLVVSEQVAEGNHVVTRGYFVPFVYQQQTLGPWRFVIWHEFDSQGKIVRQYDWINYTPKADFVGGENLNELVSPKIVPIN